MLPGVARCPACGTANPAEARFCMACATPLAALETREERRVVSVLFADLAGFTARAEALDPEDVRAILVPYHAAITSEVTTHGGRVDRFLGDGVMALFGAPVAHGDDPERAVRAGLRIVERVGALGLDLHVRVGINTGSVLFAAGAGDRDDAVTGDAVTGDAVNTAARLQAAAPLDGVVVGEATHRATAHALSFAALPAIAAKGKAHPVPLWRALGPLARAAGALPVEATPFVGRDLELSRLVALFERARTAPSVEVATIVGDAGLGKSRLVRELARHVARLPDPVTWLAGRCLPYGDGLGLWALGEIVRARAGIADGDDQAARAAKLDAVLEEPDPALRTWLNNRLAPLVGLAVATAPPMQQEAFTAWRRFLEAIARRRPTVLIVEDLHWAGGAMLAFLEHLADRAAGLPLLLVTTARPELAERHPGWLARSGHATVVSLDALPEPAMAALVGGMLPGTAPDLVAAVVARAEGSPLYAEQLAAIVRDRRAPLDGGALDEALVPPGLQGLLAARLDALPAEARRTALDAAVVGRVFWAGAVATIGGRSADELVPALDELVRRQLVRPVVPSSLAGEAEYAFWHALVRDAAYVELTRAARLARHRAFAAWLVERTTATPGEAAAIVVAHLDRALELATALRRAVDAAAVRACLVPALLAAADHAMRTHASRAPNLLCRALDLMAPDDPARPEVLARLGQGWMSAADYPAAVAALDSAAETLEARGDVVAAAELGVSRSVALNNAGMFERGQTVLDEAIAVLEAHPGPAYAAALAERAHGHALGRAPAAALEEAERAIEVASSLGLPAPHRALAARGMVGWGADPSAGLRDMQAAIEGAVREGDLRAAMMAHINRAHPLAAHDSVAAAVRAVDEAIAFAASHGLTDGEARSVRLELLVTSGEWSEALREADRVAAWAKERNLYTEVEVRLDAAYVRLERGEAIGAQDDLERMAGEAGWLPLETAPVSAGAALADHDVAAARRALASALNAPTDRELTDLVRFVRACLRADAPDLARRGLEIGAGRTHPLQLATAEAMIAEASGDLAAARGGYEQVAAEWDEIGDVAEHAYAITGLGRCLLGLGDAEEAARILLAVRATWARLGAAPRIAEIDGLLDVSSASLAPSPGRLGGIGTTSSATTR